MKHILEPLAHIPGVRIAALVTVDGVPIAEERAAHSGGHGMPESTPRGASGTSQGDPGAPESAGSSNANGAGSAADDMDVLAALAAAWIGEVNRAVAPLSWDAPRRLVLRAARGTLILQQVPGAVLLVVLEGSTRAEDLRLPMDGAVMRMQRHVKAIGSNRSNAARKLEQQPSILPSGSLERASDEVSATRSEVPEVSGE